MIDVKRAKKRIEDIKSHMRENWERMREDQRFSNPADPMQWDMAVRRARDTDARPCLTFDQTNQYVSQVVNDGRQNKPSIQTMPVDSKADVKVAKVLNGMIRHIEYGSRAGIAYDTGLEHAARIGLGYLRVIPETVNPKTKEQEIRIRRVFDPFSAGLDPQSTEPDGSDALYGYVEGSGEEDDGKKWVEYFEVQIEKQNRLAVDGEELGEDEYWERDKATGIRPEIKAQWVDEKRKVLWCKFRWDRDETEEETEFPSNWIGLIPILGDEMWIDGKRYLSGMVRKMMDGQRAYNYSRTSEIEQAALQPKAPYVAAWEAIEDHQDHWNRANQSSQSFLPYNARDESGQPLPVPQRQQPPTISAAFQQGSIQALADIQASVGMYKANLGAPSNETSGRAINARKLEGDTANFHYLDNLARSIEHLGRVIVSMIPRVYDTRRVARIVNEDGTSESIEINPRLSKAADIKDGKVVAINPGVGEYDVRVKVGPAYTTLRQEAGQALTDLLGRAPDLIPILGDQWIKMQDFPDSEKIARRLLAMAPPQVQALESENVEIPPAVQAQMMAMKQENEQLKQALGQAAQAAEGKQGELQLKAMEAQGKQQTEQAKLQMEGASLELKSQEVQIKQQDSQVKVREVEIDAYRAETERLAAVMTAQQAQAQAMQPPAQDTPPAPVETPPQIDIVALVRELMQPMAQGLGGLAQAELKPKIITLSRGPDGMLDGAMVQ